MGSNDACVNRGAVISGWRGDEGERAFGKLTAFCVLAFGEPLFPIPVQSERPCRDGDALIAVLGTAPGEVASRSRRGALRAFCDMDRQDEPR
jgi:hypothetical protein